MQMDFLYNLIAKRFTNEISDEESNILDQWISKASNKKLYEQLTNIWQESNNVNVDFDPNIEIAKTTFKERIRKAEKQNQRKLLRLRITRLAASIVLMLTLGFTLKFLLQDINTIKVITDNNNTKEIILPDSSLICLNKNTTVKYRRSFKNRVIYLNGEAFFDVKKQRGKTFTVKSNYTSTKVLGTSFNIRSRNEKVNNVEVYVLTGKVQFSGKDQTVILTPNQHAIYKDKETEIEISKEPGINLLAWRTRKLKFENNTLKEVLNILKEVYDIKYVVNSKNILDFKVTCEFENKEIEEVLRDIEIFLPIKITSENDLIRIDPIN